MRALDYEKREARAFLIRTFCCQRATREETLKTIEQAYFQLKALVPVAQEKNVNLRVDYAPFTDKLTVRCRRMIKILSRDNGEFPLEALSFEGFPKSIHSTVIFSAEREHFEVLFRYFPWTQLYATASESLNYYVRDFF